MNGNFLFLQPDEFTQAAAQALAALPDVEIVGIEELSIALRVRGRDVASDLTTFYRAYENAPDQLAAIQQALIEALTDLPPDRTEDDPQALLPRVFPMLKPQQMVDLVAAQGLPPLVQRPFLDELVITYVIDEGQSVAYINDDHLQRWNLDFVQLHATAIGNLRARSQQIAPGMIGTGATALFVCSNPDGYAAARILVPDVFAAFAAHVPGKIVIGIPNRDFLIAFSDANAQVFARVRDQIAADARNQVQGLTAQLFTLHKGTIQLYDRA